MSGGDQCFKDQPIKVCRRTRVIRFELRLCSSASSCSDLTPPPAICQLFKQSPRGCRRAGLTAGEGRWSGPSGGGGVRAGARRAAVPVTSHKCAAGGGSSRWTNRQGVPPSRHPLLPPGALPPLLPALFTRIGGLDRGTLALRLRCRPVPPPSPRAAHGGNACPPIPQTARR